MKSEISQKEYKKILEKIPILCVDVIVKHKNKVLILLRVNNPAKECWWVPGGRVLKGEKLVDAVKRKVLEEAGFEVEIKKQVGTYETIFNNGPFSDLKSGVHTLNVCFLAVPKIDNPTIILDKTSSDYRWFKKIENFFPECIKTILIDSKVFE